MSPAKSKKCVRCGEGFRGTMASEEVHCAKCYVKTCEVPDDIDEQFLKLVSETHGPELAKPRPTNTSNLMPMMKDMLNHKARLQALEKGLEENEKISPKEKNRRKRELFRIREEQTEMNTIMESLQAKVLHLTLMQTSNRSSVAEQSEVDSPEKPPTPPDRGNEKENVPSTPPAININRVTTTPPRSPPRITQPQIKEENGLKAEENSPKPSPVKLAAAKFEEAAKRVNSVVTFAKLPAKRYAEAPRIKKEMNNNDTPVTASSSSEDEAETEQPSMLVRSNSVRDRIKAFEDIQRSASMGAFDRKRAAGFRRMQQPMTNSMKEINN